MAAALTTWRERLLETARVVLPRPPYDPAPIQPPEQGEDAIATYEVAFNYYYNVKLYDQIRKELVRKGEKVDAVKGIRNPAFRLVEFYATHLWHGKVEEAFTFETTAASSVRSAIADIWRWSGWEVKKTSVIRKLAIAGDGFLKVSQFPDGRPFLQSIDPREVTDFELTHDQSINFIRLDAYRHRPYPPYEAYVRTEVWDADRQDLRIWETSSQVMPQDLDRTDPLLQLSFQELKLDAVPIVWFPFRDVGEDRAVGAYTFLLDKIDECNRAATRLHQILFRYNRPMFVHSAAGGQRDRNPIPMPRIPGMDEAGASIDEDEWIHAGEGVMTQLVPNLHYGEALQVLDAQMSEVVRDAVELMYYRITELGDDLTGRSGRLMMEPAIRRCEEVATNANWGLVRAQTMALQIGQRSGIWPDLAQDLTHGFRTPEIIPVSVEEQSRANQANGQAAVYWREAGADPKAIARAFGSDAGIKPSDMTEPPSTNTIPSPTNTSIPPQPAGTSSGG